MSKIIWAICLLACFSCTKSGPEKRGLTNEERSSMIVAAVKTKTTSSMSRGTLDVKNTEKTNYRIAFTEKSLFSQEDIDGGKIHLREVIAFDVVNNFTSFGYVLAGSDSNIQSSTGSFTLAVGPSWGTYTGYILMNDGCYHHGTFIWSGTRDNYVFQPDNGKNNSGQSSTGFEGFCLTDDEFVGMC